MEGSCFPNCSFRVPACMFNSGVCICLFVFSCNKLDVFLDVCWVFVAVCFHRSVNMYGLLSCFDDGQAFGLIGSWLLFITSAYCALVYLCSFRFRIVWLSGLCEFDAIRRAQNCGFRTRTSIRKSTHVGVFL